MTIYHYPSWISKISYHFAGQKTSRLSFSAFLPFLQKTKDQKKVGAKNNMVPTSILRWLCLNSSISLCCQLLKRLSWKNSPKLRVTALNAAAPAVVIVQGSSVSVDIASVKFTHPIISEVGKKNYLHLSMS